MKVKMGDDDVLKVDPEMMERCRIITAAIIPVIQGERENDVAAVLAMLLGQNIGYVSRAAGIPLETLVDRITLAVRVNAQQELTDAQSGTESTSSH